MSIPTLLTSQTLDPDVPGASSTPPAKHHIQRPASRFALLWAATTASALASAIVKIALPLAALAQTRAPLSVAAVTFALNLPWLLASVPAGALVDRLDRRTFALAATTLRLVALGLLALPMFITLPRLSLLYLVALLLGLADVGADAAFNVLTPMVTPHERLEHANTWLIGAQQVIEVIGSPLGAMLIAAGLLLTTGAGAMASVAALVALLCLGGAFHPRRLHLPSGHKERRHLLGDLLDGFRVLLRQRILLTLAVMAAVINACWSAWMAVFALYAVAPGPLRLTATQYGLLFGVGGVGGLGGALLAPLVFRRLGRRWAIGLNILCNCLMLLMTAFTINIWLVGAAILLGNSTGPLWTIAATALLQRMVPTANLGRVRAAYQVLGVGAEALGPILGGVAAELVGVRAVFLGGGLLTALMFIPFALIVTERAMAGAPSE
ncbi:MAG: MFS transporter [Ktedonobacterales bacterium]